MEAIIFTKDQFTELMSKLDTIQSQINIKAGPKQETYLGNIELMALLDVSKRTAQTWRDEGKISFSQMGSKIYYKLSDVDKFMQENYNKAFKSR